MKMGLPKQPGPARKAADGASEKSQSAQETARKWWVLVAIGMGTFMSALDGSVVNISLPKISETFLVDVAAIEWVVTVYLLVLGGLLLSFGRLGDMRGHKPVYLTGFFIFILASALCGFAWNLQTLVAFRGIQALGAAMLMANSPAILTKSFPAAQRGQALGIQATMTYLGLTVGPSVGGWLTTNYSWRAVFYINIPVGLLAFWLSSRFIPADQPSGKQERFDLAGAALFIGGLVSLLLGLNQGHEQGWDSPIILALLAAAAVLLAVFVRVELRTPHPMLDLSLFKRRIFTLSVSSAVFNYICIYSILFLMPFYLIRARGFSAAEAGMLLTAQPIVMALVAPISGTLSDRIGPRLLGTLGMACLAGGLAMLALLGPDAPKIQIMLSLALTGLGTGTFISPNNSALMGSAPKGRQGIAAGVLATARNVGMVLGIGLAGAMFNTMLAQAGVDPAQIGPQSGPGLFSAFSSTFWVVVVVALLGTLTSAVRSSTDKDING